MCPLGQAGVVGYEKKINAYLQVNHVFRTKGTFRMKTYFITRWRHQMKTFSALLAICAGNSPVPGEFPAQRPVTRSFDIFFDLRLNKRLSKQSWGWWFETLSRPLWRHCNGILNMYCRWWFRSPPIIWGSPCIVLGDDGREESQKESCPRESHVGPTL